MKLDHSTAYSVERCRCPRRHARTDITATYRRGRLSSSFSPKHSMDVLTELDTSDVSLHTNIFSQHYENVSRTFTLPITFYSLH